jgi:pyruvate formate lyase activating enzyme
LSGRNIMASEHDNVTGVISAIQKYSTKDGPGIRDTVFLKGCSLRCGWCSNPELIHPAPEMFQRPELCIGCGACLAACPRGALTRPAEAIRLDRNSCDGCGRCAAVCPAGVYESVGQRLTVAEALAELLKDRVFYETSGGGVTFSGGEPLLQPEFVGELARRLQENHIHTAVETAGLAPWSNFAGVLGAIDLVLYDIKLMGSEKHCQYTGAANEFILENALKIAERGIPMIARLVVIPGVNDGEAEFRDRLEFVKRLATVEQVDILGYHRYGLGKYTKLGREYPLPELAEPAEGELKKMKLIAEAYGFQTTLGGS